jgi:hypothetical protein
MVWQSIRRRAVSFLCAVVSITAGGEIAIRPCLVHGAEIPEFAKSVRVRVDGGLLSLDEAVKTKAADPKQNTYREMRSAMAGTAEGQLELARWCRKQKLGEEERLHWWTLLGMRPGHAEAIKGLQLRRFQGLLLTSEEIDLVKKQQAAAEKAEKQWTPKLKKIKQAIEHGEVAEREAALNELKSISDPLAIPSIEKVFGFNDVRVGRQLIEMAANMPGDGAEFLARLAVIPSDEYVRNRAAEALKTRPYSTYVPKLIAGLAAPIEMSSRVSVEAGQPKYEWYEGTQDTGRLVQGGLPTVIRLRSKRQPSDIAYYWYVEKRRIAGCRNTGQTPDRLRYDYELSRDSPDPDAPYEQSGAITGLNHAGTRNRGAISFEKSIADLDKEVKEANKRTEALNERIHGALKISTGAKVVPDDQFGTPKPQVWWDWWKKQLEQNGFFARGTEVWTETGPMAIETILVGDRVLTRDPASGELAFHLVTSTQMKSSGEMRTIELDSRTIVSTPSQQFMVSGAGWKAADELKDGLKLDGLAGPRLIKSNSSGKGADMYGLVVADVSTLFVDRLGILVHDASRP